MNSDILDAIQDLEEQINETQKQIDFIKSIDFTKPVTESQWHKICETPLRYSNLLATLVKNTFPLAENILVHCNYVYFDLLGFKVQIPTSYCQGINVDTSWYHKGDGEPTRIYTGNVKNMIEYFNAVDNKLGWYECAKYRIPHSKTYKKWTLFILWWLKYKWKVPERKQFEVTKKQQEEAYKERVEKYLSKRQDIRNKAKFLLYELLPLLNQFSLQHGKYSDNRYAYSIEQIKEFEDL